MNRLKLEGIAFSALSSLPIYYFIMGSFRPLNPKEFQWISGDNTAAYIAQLFFLSDKWRYPLAANPDFGLSLSTSLIYTGPPLPIVIVQKLLRLDPSLQFIGPWLLAMLILHTFFGFLLGTSLGLDRFQSMIFGVLLVTPFLLFRFQFHYWLISHFLLLWAIWIVVRKVRNLGVTTFEVSFLLVCSYLINSYLLVMVLIVLFYLVIRNPSGIKQNLRNGKHKLLVPLITLFLTYLVFDFRAQKASTLESIRMNFTGEYTYYPSNLLALFNPEVGFARDCSKGHCMFGDGEPPSYVLENFSFTNLDLGGVQGNEDGYLYLGLGLILLLILALTLELRRFSKGKILYLWLKNKVFILYAAMICAYSITYKISISNFQLDLGDPKLVRWGLSIFRASGRFMWIIAYVLLILTILVLIKYLRRKGILTLVLLLALSLQVLDVGSALRHRQVELSKANINSIPSLVLEEKSISKWSQDKETLHLYPVGSREGWPTMAYLAWKYELASGSISTSRLNYAELARTNFRLKTLICSGEIPSTWIVAVANDSISDFSECEKFSKLILQQGEKFYLLVSSQQ